MNLLDLPVDIQIVIFGYLDLKSKINLYNSCEVIRSAFVPCHIKKIVLSRNAMFTTATLEEDLFNRLGRFIQELNLSGISNLTTETLRPHIKEFKNLKVLDITFTDIYLSDFVELCPCNLQEVSLNFFKCPRTCNKYGVWNICKKIFIEKLFKSIHFVVFEFLDSGTPLQFLEGVPVLENLKITVADNYKDFWEPREDNLNQENNVEIMFSKLSYIFRDCPVSHKTSDCLKGVSNLNYDQLEYIFISYLEEIVIYISPIFGSVFSADCNNLQVKICTYLPLDIPLDGNIIFKAWNKRSTIFNKEFFDNLKEELRDYFPIFVCLHKQIQISITNAFSDWYCIDGCAGFELILKTLPTKVTLTDYCRQDGAFIRNSHPISLSNTSETLKNITFMRLSNISIRKNFFEILFSQCVALNTLDLYVEKIEPFERSRNYISLLGNGIDFAKKLRNFKLTSEDIEYETLFNTLSACPILENIHISEYERIFDDTVNTSSIEELIGKCDRLYSLFIEADMSPEALTLMISPLRETAQKLNKDQLYIEVCECYRGWNLFADVFNPSPLHICD